MIIFELLVVIMVVGMTFSVAKDMAEGERVEKANSAEDIRMMIDTLVGVPGDAVVEYPYNVSKYAFTLDKNGVTVFEKGEDKANWAVRSIHLPLDYKLAGALDEEERLCLEKTSKNIFLRECKSEEK